MKFHHNQKVKIISGYYNTFKGRIIDAKINIIKGTNPPMEETLYNVKIQLNKEETKDEWINEKSLKVSIW